jgi:hypothetical protein
MSTAEILAELTRLSAEERRQIARRLAELEGGVINRRGDVFPPGDVAELRARLDRFAEEWDSPEMSIYDDYDGFKADLQTR